MAFRFILLVIPTLSLASIDVEILIQNANDVIVNYKGYDIANISETEITTFNLTSENLIEAVNSVTKIRPTSVYIRKLSPEDKFTSLDGKYKWQGITRTFVPGSNKIFWPPGIRTVVDRQLFENNSTIPVTVNVGISQFVENTVMSSWSTSSEFSGVKIYYSIKNKVARDDEEPFRYTSSWGEHTQQSQTVTVGASSNMDMTLQPGEAVVAQLEATRELVKVEMEYIAYLAGRVVAYYQSWMGYSFYGIPINLCMKSAGLSNMKTSREFIDIDFFSDYKVVVSDLRNATSS